MIDVFYAEFNEDGTVLIKGKVRISDVFAHECTKVSVLDLGDSVSEGGRTK
jgi:hypothetical protein